MKIFFLVTIDTECDKSFDWSVRQPLSFRSIVEGIPQRLQPLFHRYNVSPTYLLSPEVILNPESVNTLKNLSGSFELGAHLHGEFIDPNADMSSVSTKLFQGDYAYEVEFEKMKNLTDLFISSFGYTPTSFRAGRFGMGQHTLAILERLGYLVDSSVFPLHIIDMDNITNNFYNVPLTAYFPDIYNFRKEDKSKRSNIVEIPVTVYSSLYCTMPPFIRKFLSKRSYVLAGMKKMLGREKVKPFTLRPSSLSFDLMKFVVDRHIELYRKNDVVFLTMMFHSNEIIENASPYCISTAEVQKLLDSLGLIFQYVQGLGAQFISMTDVWQIMMESRR